MSDSESDSSIEPNETPVIQPKIKKKKKIVQKVVEVEVTDDEEEPPPPKVVKKKGRPFRTEEEKNAKQIITKEKIIYMIPQEDGTYKKTKAPTSERAMKKIQLQQDLEKKEKTLGKQLLARKNGKVDKRSLGKRSEAQIKATEIMLAKNKIRREMKAKEKEQQQKKSLKETVKDSVREVVKEPFYEPKPAKPPEPVNPYAGLF